MANSKSAKKRIVQNARNHAVNQSVRARMKTEVKKAMTAIEAKDAEQIKAALPEALSEIDRAASRGIIHANSASRKKSTLQRLALAAGKSE